MKVRNAPKTAKIAITTINVRVNEFSIFFGAVGSAIFFGDLG
jgi:hypothetical protein